MKQTATKKLSILLCITLLTAFTLTGCMPSFDASAYVKACLDANTKAEFAPYAELTDSTIEEVEALYNQAIDTEMSYLETYDLTDERKEEFRTLFIDMYKNFKYEVGEATRNEDDSYTVPITTYKLMVYEGIVEGSETYLLEYAENEMNAGNTPSQEQLTAEALNYMYDSMRTNTDALTYAEPVTINVTVSPTKNGSQVVYTIIQEDLQTVMESFIDIENAQ